MYRLPSRSKAISDGDFRAAAAAGPPSPAKPAWPLPATVSRAPVFLRMRRTRAAFPSEKTRLPSGSTTTFETESSERATEEVAARLPSGENAWVPAPALVVIVCASAGSARARANAKAEAKAEAKARTEPGRMRVIARLSQGRGQGAGAASPTLPRESTDISLR